MKPTEIGKAWIIHSEETNGKNIKLISIQSSRKTIKNIASYVEQLYVDKFASIEEKIAYKKKTSNWPYPAEISHPTCIVSCGFGPIYFAHFSHHISIDGNLLIAKYHFIKTIDNDYKPVEYTDNQVVINIA